MNPLTITLFIASTFIFSACGGGGQTNKESLSRPIVYPDNHIPPSIQNVGRSGQLYSEKVTESNGSILTVINNGPALRSMTTEEKDSFIERTEQYRKTH